MNIQNIITLIAFPKIPHSTQSLNNKLLKFQRFKVQTIFITQKFLSSISIASVSEI